MGSGLATSDLGLPKIVTTRCAHQQQPMCGGAPERLLAQEDRAFPLDVARACFASPVERGRNVPRGEREADCSLNIAPRCLCLQPHSRFRCPIWSPTAASGTALPSAGQASPSHAAASACFRLPRWASAWRLLRRARPALLAWRPAARSKQPLPKGAEHSTTELLVAA